MYDYRIIFREAAMDYLSFSKRFFAATGIPVTLLDNGKPVYSSLHQEGTPLPDMQWDMWKTSKNPEFLTQTANLEYGRVRIEDTAFDIIIGPLLATPITDEVMEEFLRDHQTPREHREIMKEILYGAPLISHSQCLRYLSFLHLCLNHKETNVEDYYAEETDDELKRARQELHTSVEYKENDMPRSSYAFELQLYHYIEMGDVGRLKTFLESIREFPLEGRMANTPLRHAKNILISAGSKAVVMGAVPGGMDAEKAYQLLDLYAVECEQMQTLEDVHRLQYIMMMDLCQRTGNTKIPKGVSSEIYRCVTYIKMHTNTPLSVNDIARHINRSRSYLMRQFKAEMGIQVNAYITLCKLEEACDMLIYSDASLSEISAYLCYSSQSYFQNVFKKAYGVTPIQYRKQHSKIK